MNGLNNVRKYCYRINWLPNNINSGDRIYDMITIVFLTHKSLLNYFRYQTTIFNKTFVLFQQFD